MPETSRAVLQSIVAHEQPEGVGAVVRRSIGSAQLPELSPFLMFDHGRVDQGSGFSDHPHRGFATVSLVLNGAIEHEDSVGNHGKLDAGDLQWMTAGRGVIHAEMPAKGMSAEILQLWIDLPKQYKMIEPNYQELKASEIPSLKVGDILIKVISGEFRHVKSPVKPLGGCWYFDVHIEKADAEVFIPLPEGWASFAYTLSGDVSFDQPSHVIEAHRTVVFSQKPGESGVHIKSHSAAGRLVLLAAEPLNQPVFKRGPFVMTTQEDLIQAFRDYQFGQNGFESAPAWRSKIAAHM